MILRKLPCSTIPCAMAVPSDRERLARLETRAKEADNALKQLKSYVQLLKTKAGDPQSAAQEAECKTVEVENEQLIAQVAHLKKRLVELEIRNGVLQIPNPGAIQPSQAPPTQTPTSPPAQVDKPKPKKAEGGKEKGGGGGGGGGGGASSNAKGREKKKGGGAADAAVDVSRLDFRIGRILSAECHPDADTLYVEQVDVGEEKPRNVCSGIKSIPLEQLENRLVVMLCNLKPVKMRGVVSEAMVMCASAEGMVEIIDPPDGCAPGDRISFEGYTGTPDALLNPKKKVFEQVQPDFLVTEEGVATYRGIPFTVAGKGICRVPTMRGCGIK